MSLSTSSSYSSSSSSSWAESTSSQTESTSSSPSSASSLSSSSSSEIKATQIPFDFRGVTWNISKDLVSAIPAINSGVIFNKACQSIKILFNQYSIKYTSCYLKRVGGETDYNIILEIWDTDEGGRPLTLLDSSSIPASIVEREGWYNFDFSNSLLKDTPSNQFLSFVMYQVGGDDQNYINWFYFPTSNEINNKAFTSKNNGAEWSEQIDVVRLIKTSDAFDMFGDAYFDSENHHIQLAGGKESTLKSNGESYLSEGTFDNSHITQRDNKKCVEILYQPLVVSILVDNSGSMGWNDRYFDRKKTINDIIQKLNTQYPNKVFFDVVSFGSLQIDKLDFSSSKTYATIKVDLNNPDRFTYNKDGSAPSMSDSFVAWGFEKLEASHEYVIASMWSSPSKTIIEDGRGTLDSTLGIYKPTNYQSIGNQNRTIAFYTSENMGVGSEEGNGTPAIVGKILSADTTTIRKAVGPNRDLSVALLLQDINSDQNQGIIDNPRSFNANTLVDVLDANNIERELKITNVELVDGQYTMTFDRSFPSQVENSFSLNGGFVQETSPVLLNINPEDTMMEILLKDAKTTRRVVFYMQSSKGGVLEWDIEPFKEWENFLYFYADNSGNLLMNGVDSAGEPLPNGTRVDLYVDGEKPPDFIEQNNSNNFLQLKEPIQPGGNQFTLYENDENTNSVFETIEENESITLMGENSVDGNVETVTSEYTISSIFESTIPDVQDLTKSVKTKTIIFTPTHNESWVATHFLVFVYEEPLESLKLNVPISAVNTTPVIQGKDLSSEYLLPSDPPQLPYNYDLNQVNQDKGKKVDNITSIPTINGITNLKILPITEDVIQTVSDQNSNPDALYGKKILTYSENVEKEKQEQEYLRVLEREPDIILKDQEESSSSSQSDGEEKEYTIETPVYMDAGEANSHMSSKAYEMTSLSYEPGVSLDSPIKYIGISYLNVLPDSPTISQKNNYTKTLLARIHQVSPYITITNNKKTIQQELQTINVNFAAPIQICSNITSPTKEYFAIKDTPDDIVKISEKFPCVYASTETSAKIDYLVYYKGVLLKNGYIKVKVFDATRSQIDLLNIQESPEPDLPFISEKYMVSQGVDENDVPLPPLPFSEQFQKYREDPTILYVDSDQNKTEATYLPGYAAGGYVLRVKNGRASLTINSSESIKFVSHLQILAEVISPENPIRSTIRLDNLFLSNPLEIHPYIDGSPAADKSEIPAQYYFIAESEFFSFAEPKTKYNLGAKITWLGEPVPDNIASEMYSNTHNRNTVFNKKTSSLNKWDALAKLNNLVLVVQQAASGNTSAIGDYYASLNTPISTYDTWPATPLYPSVSKTINGIAQDCYIGEHGDVIPHFVTLRFQGEPIEVRCGDSEKINLKTSWRGMAASSNLEMMWMGTDPEESESDPVYISTIIYKNGELNNGADLYADGWDYAIALADIPVSYIGGFPNMDKIKPWLCGEIKKTDGISQPMTANFSLIGETPNIFSCTSSWSTKKPIDPVTNQPLELIIQNYPQNMAAWLTSSPITKSFIPIPPKPDSDMPECQKCKPDYCTKLILVFNVKTGTDNYTVRGCRSTNINGCFCIDDETEQIDKSDWFKPTIMWKNPLIGEMSFVTEDDPPIREEVVRDGRTRTLITVDISFSGKAIPLIAKEHNVIPQFKDTSLDKNLTWEERAFKLLQTAASTRDVGQSTIASLMASNATYEGLYEANYKYYTDILKNFKNSQQNQSLTLKKDKVTVNWINYFPNVVFDIYLGEKDIEENEELEETSTKKVSNVRRIKNLTLSQYDVILSLNQTSNKIPLNPSESSSSSSQQLSDYSDTENGHYHTCSVNENGTGKTINTYTYKSLVQVENHEHIIDGFEVKNAYDNEIHYHTLKSTASTWINPFTLEDLGPVEENTNIYIDAYLEYDASKTYTERTLLLQRVIPLFDSQEEKDKLWKFTLHVPSTAFVSPSTTNEYNGFDVSTSLMRNDGTLAPDGTRIQIEMKSYAPENYLNQKESNNIVIQQLREYIIVKTIASVKIENMKFEQKKLTRVYSKLNWLPKIRNLTSDLTNEEFYLEKATDKIECIGCSQIYDGILQSLSRLKKFYMERSDLRDGNFLILMFTDGEENESANSIDYMLKNLIQSSRFPTYPVPVGEFITPIGENLLNTISKLSYGEATTNKNVNSDDIFEYIKSILQSQQSNYGVYYNTISLTQPRPINSIIYDANFPTGSKILASFRVGNTINNLSSWSDEFTIDNDNKNINIGLVVGDEHYKHFQYRLKLIGNENFESPSYFGNSLNYIEPFSTMVFFKPINIKTGIEEFISEIVITHKISGDENIDIQYGFTYENSTKESDYYNEFSKPIRAGSRYIILARTNEKMITTNNFSYMAVNGPWPEICNVEVYKILANQTTKTLIPSSEYTFEPQKGEITLNKGLENLDTVLLSLSFPSSFRIMCKVNNYSSNPAYLDHLGILYNIAQKSI